MKHEWSQEERLDAATILCRDPSYSETEARSWAAYAIRSGGSDKLIDLQCQINVLRERLQAHTLQPGQCMCFLLENEKCGHCLDLQALVDTATEGEATQ